MNFWCRVLGHRYRYFETDDYKYRECIRCKIDDIIGKSSKAEIKEFVDVMDAHVKLYGRMISRLNAMEEGFNPTEEIEESGYTSKW